MKQEYVERPIGNGRCHVYVKVGNRLIDHLWNAKIGCKHNEVVQPGGGIKCVKCGGWCCF